MRKNRKWNLNKVWVRISNILTAIGAVSVFDSIKMWAALFKWITGKIRSALPMVVDALQRFGELLPIAVELYRTVLYPPINWIFRWAPFTIR